MNSLVSRVSFPCSCRKGMRGIGRVGGGVFIAKIVSTAISAERSSLVMNIIALSLQWSLFVVCFSNVSSSLSSEMRAFLVFSTLFKKISDLLASFPPAPRQAPPRPPALAAIQREPAAFSPHCGRYLHDFGAIARGGGVGGCRGAAESNRSAGRISNSRIISSSGGSGGAPAGGRLPSAVAPGRLAAAAGPGLRRPGRGVPTSRPPAAAPRALEGLRPEREGRGGVGGSGGAARAAGANAACAAGTGARGGGVGGGEG